MKDFDLYTLRLFVAVCDSGNILSTSEREHIDPSAITKRIAKLEKDLGVKLLNRSTKGVTPTTEGLGLLHGARELIANANQLSDQMSGFQAEQDDTVEIIANTTIWSGFLPYDISNFLNDPKHKHVNILMRDGDKAAIAEAVHEGRIPLGITWDRRNLKGLKTVPYRPQHIAAYIHHTHPLSKKKKLTYDEVAHLDRVAIFSNRTVELELASQKIINPTVLKFRAVAPNFELALRMAEMQVGILLAPLEMKLFVNTPSLVVIPLTDTSARRDYFICFQNENTLSYSAQILLKHLTHAATAQ